MKPKVYTKMITSYVSEESYEDLVSISKRKDMIVSQLLRWILDQTIPQLKERNKQ